MKTYVPYDFETKKFASEWNSGGCSGVDWVDSPIGCLCISDWHINYFKEKNPNQPLSKMIPSLQRACSRSAQEDIKKCGVVEVELSWKFA